MSFPSPYITPEDLLAAPLPVSWTQMGPTSATPDQNLAQMAEICDIATNQVNGDCGQVLRATVDTETVQAYSHRCGIEPNGWARMLTSMHPILRVVSAQVSYGDPQISNGVAAFQWTQVTPGMAFPVQQPFGVYGSGAPGGATAGQNAVYIAGGYVTRAGGRYGTRVSLTYVNGWPHTAIAADSLVSATVLTVDDVTGWYNASLAEGAVGRIYDGANTENVHVTAVTPTTPGLAEPAGPGTVTLALPTSFAHKAGVLLSALPSSIRDAAKLFAAAQGLRGGMASLIAASIAGGGSGGGIEGAMEYLTHEAAILLGPYRRAAF